LAEGVKDYVLVEIFVEADQGRREHPNPVEAVVLRGDGEEQGVGGMTRNPALRGTGDAAHVVVTVVVDVALESYQDAAEGPNVGDSERHTSKGSPGRLVLWLAPGVVPWNHHDLQPLGSEPQDH
jgi:hypothetical protein